MRYVLDFGVRLKRETTENIMHLAIIPDGNRRWAQNKGLPSFMGHKVGGETMERIVTAVFDMGVSHLTVWGASVANVIERSKEEISFLFSVFEDNFRKLMDSPELAERKVRVRILGEWRERMPEGLKNLYEEIIRKTEKNDGPALTFMMAYSGTGEMLEAVKILTDKKIADPKLEITKDALKKSLITYDLPPVDLAIRAGGEPHWSDGFMMWDIANTHFYFTETLWPDFSVEELRLVVDKFKGMEKRLGR